MTGSYPKPNWYTQGLNGRSFKIAMGNTLFREQYLDAVSVVINDQEMAGLDILTDGDALGHDFLVRAQADDVIPDRR